MKKLDAQALIICVGLIVAGTLAFNEKPGWGWVLVVTVLVMG